MKAAAKPAFDWGSWQRDIWREPSLSDGLSIVRAMRSIPEAGEPQPDVSLRRFSIPVSMEEPCCFEASYAVGSIQAVVDQLGLVLTGRWWLQWKPNTRTYEVSLELREP